MPFLFYNYIYFTAHMKRVYSFIIFGTDFFDFHLASCRCKLCHIEGWKLTGAVGEWGGEGVILTEVPK
jgi:hypothetical protein